MKKEDGQKNLSVQEVMNYKRKYVVNASKNIYGKGFAVVVEGEIVLNTVVWNKGTHISPKDKMKVEVEWLKDLIKVLEVRNVAQGKNSAS